MINGSAYHLFRAYDIRGEYGTDLDPLMMYQIGISTAKVMKKEKNIIKAYVGYDIRKTSQLLAISFLSGLTAMGVEVTFSNKAFPFGVTMFSGLKSDSDFTAFITASHLPPNWNGIKFYYADGVGFPESKIIDIRNSFLELNSNFKSQLAGWQNITPIMNSESHDEYSKFFIDKFSLNHPLNVIIDCGNGSASISAPEIFKKCNYKLTELWSNVDATFPNRPSEPNEKTLTVISKKIKDDNTFDFGVGFDGDGDRAVIIDNKGRVIPSDIIAILLAPYLKDFLKIDKPLVLANIECSSLVEKVLGNEFEIKRIKVGHTFLTLEARLNKNRCVLGVESSGHFVFPFYFLFDDALLIPLILGKFLQEKTQNLSELVDNIPILFSKREVFKCEDKIKFEIISDLLNDLKKEFSDINSIDGIAITLPEGYVLIRASNTGPKIRLYVESESEDDLIQLFEVFSQKLNQKIAEKL